VRAAILALLAERPMHGYEMIGELETRSHGHWHASAGSIYPTLQLLEDEGLVTSAEADGKRRYSLTDAGRAEAEQRRTQQFPWEQMAERGNAPGARLRDAASEVTAAAIQAARVGSDDQVARVQDLLAETRRRIYSILAEDA
jgi:DNA-binding PadR family transcriptional regulator